LGTVAIFVAFTAVMTEFVIFWVVALYSVMVGYQKIKAARSSETLISNHHTTRRDNPEIHEFLGTVAEGPALPTDKHYVYFNITLY
jgi:hypothetical protein